MIVVGILVLAAIVVAVAFGLRIVKAGKSELEVILSDLSSVVGDLETFADSKSLEIADHVEEVVLHQKHISVKGAERDRAQRIRDKLNELLA